MVPVLALSLLAGCSNSRVVGTKPADNPSAVSEVEQETTIVRIHYQRSEEAV